MKKVRVLIINNPLTALFMNLRLREVESPNDGISTLIFYEQRRVPAGYSENSLQHEYDNKKFCTCLFEDKYLIYRLPEIFYRYLSFIEFLIGCFEIKQEQIDNKYNLTKFLKANQLDDLNILEIWHGNTIWQKYLSLNHPSSKKIKFDHGLSETLGYFSYGRRALIGYLYLKFYLRRVINFILGLYFIIPPIDAESDEHFTLNSAHINAALKRQETKMLVIDSEAIGNLSILKPAKKIDQSATTAIILLDNIKPWAKSVLDHQEYFSNFEAMLTLKVAPKLRSIGVDTLLLKPKHWQEEYAREAIQNFKLLSKSFNLKYFPDYYNNMPLEYFLMQLQPKVIFGNLSSGLYYAKHFMPEVETYTYDQWFVEYTMMKFGETYPDFQRMRPILFESQLEHFKLLNPISL
jgi:hypothetical protein